MPDNDVLIAHIRQQISDFRRKLLDLTLRNPLLSFRHNERAATHVRIVDERPDVIFEKLEGGSEMEFLALEPPRLQPDDEETEEFIATLAEFKRTDPIYREEHEALERRRVSQKSFSELERKARDRVRFRLRMPEWEPESGLRPADLARRRGFDPSYDLPNDRSDDTFERHHDDGLQTLHFIDQLEAKLRGLRDRARSSVRETGIPILSAAFGFLEWYEDEKSERVHYAPLLILPLEVNRRRQGQRYRYFVTSLDQPTRSNITLERYLEHHFGLVLPSFEIDDTPESYFTKVESLCGEKTRWQVRRFLTVGVFPFSKLAIYEDLDLDRNWTDPQAFLGHPAMTALIASAGDAESPFGDDYAIDEPAQPTSVPQLIYDADSSQHSAIIDVLSDMSLAIHGPPGTGKSQTITNIIAAAIAAGKSVLFVAEKLAALEVVADRLNKAGLANFCLNLHGRHIRKSDVLTSFKGRLEMARPIFDTVQYQHDLEEWTAQRDALKHYAQIINDPVGRLNLSAHDILWRNIEKKDHLASLPNALRRLEFPSASEIGPTEARATREALDTLGESYGAAMNVIVDMAMHPWRGVRRVDLTPFDVSVACDLAGDWAAALITLQHLVDDVFIHDTLSQPSFGEVTSWISGLQRLPTQIPPLCLHQTNSICRREVRADIIRFIENLRTIEDTGRMLAKMSRLDHFESLDSDAIERLREASMNLGVSHMTWSQIKAEISTSEQHVESLSAVRTALQRLMGLFGIEDISEKALQITLAGTRHVTSADREILLRRTDRLVDETNRLILREAKAQIDALQGRRAELSDRFHLGDLLKATILRGRATALRDSGLFKGLGREVRSAKALYRRLCKSSDKRSPRQMAEDFESLAQYVEATAALSGDERLAEILGADFRGVGTDMTVALRVNTWAAEVVGMFPGIDPIRRAARETLLRGDITVLDESRNIWSAMPESMQESLARGETSLADLRENERTARDRVEQLHRLHDGVLSIALAPDKTLADLEHLKDILGKRHSAYTQAAACTAAETFFGEDFHGADTDVAHHSDVISTLAALDDSGLPDATCAALLTWAGRNGSHIGRLQETLSRSHAVAEDLWKQLGERLDIDPVVFFPPYGPDGQLLNDLIDRANRCTAADEALTTWRTLQTNLNTARLTVGRPVVEAYEAADEPFTGIADTFDCILYQSLANRVLREHPDLQRLSGNQLTNHRHAFATLDERLLELERRRIASDLFGRPVEAGVGMGRPGDYSERALIQHQVSLQRSNLPLRDLLNRAGNAARQLKPCFMMSPLTVAQYLPRVSGLFDLVVIDEASQMRPEDAFGTIVRGKQCVVVGDPMQLPPTSFFETSFWSSESDEDDDRLFEQVDSILDLALRAFRPTRYLRWHYRSQHSSLIAFSNRRFYDNKLVVFPGANEDDPEAGVHFQHITGNYAGSQNVTEAEAVVKASLAFMMSARTRNLSLGVVAINQPQRDLLEELFDRAFAENTQAERYRRKWDNTLYPFFVKNLENVQGDERDAIFISMTYGPDATTGTVYQRFGPIAHSGGHRRLNVLFTRARRLVRVFSSMTTSDIQIVGNTSEGTRILRDYLDYAATGRLESGRDVGAFPESPFEEVVKAALEAHGYIVTPQVGIAGYRIDLGLSHPDYPHGYILGVECDGATYHAAKSVRDRDRLRQMILEGLGWEIYRIWSTDWFHNPERELDKLLEHLRQRIEQAHRGTDAGTLHEVSAPYRVVVNGDSTPENASVAHQEVRPTTPEIEPRIEADDSETAPGQEEDRPVVEIGDVVTYERLGHPGNQRKVQIVNGPDDPDRGIINDVKPLAIALLGAAEGEHVTVEQPTHSLEIKVARIEKSLSNVSMQDNLTGSTPDDDNRSSDVEPSSRLRPYTAWQGNHVPDPRTTDADSTAQTLLEIIECEGPVLVARVYRLYAKACGLQRAGRQVRSSLNRILSGLIRAKRVALEDENDKPGQINSIVHVAGRHPVRLRTRGPRTFDESPLSEIDVHLRLIKDSEPDLGKEELFRELLSRYELVRITSSVRTRLELAARSTFS